MGVSRSVKLKANDGLVYQFTNEKLSASSEGIQTFNHTTHAYNLVKMFEHLYIGIASRDLLAVVDLVDSRLSSRARLQPESHKSEVLQFLGTALQHGLLHCRAIPETKPVIIHTELPSVPLMVSSGTTLPKGGAEAPITPSEDQIRVDTPAVAIKETEFCGDPVSMVSGEEILMIDDASLSGAQPITWGRMYRSGQCQFDVGMGYGWRSQYQYELVLLEPEDQPEIWRFIDNEGCTLYFDVIAKGAVSYQLRAGASLYHHPKGYYLLRLSDGRQLRFSWRYEGWCLDKLRIDQTTQYGFRYSSAGRMIGIETNGFLRVVLRYDASGHLVTVEMPSKEDDSIVNVIASYHYNADGQLVAATNRNKQTERYQYRDDHLLTYRQRASGFSHYFEWLGSGSTAKCRAQWGDNHCYQYQFDYDNSASSTISTDSRGHQWHYYHNEQGLLVKKISPAGATWRYEYNQLGLKVAGIDPNGSVTRYDYNAQGLLCALHAPSGAITRYCYNRFGQLTEQCSPLGHITTHRFNSLGLLLETRHPEGTEDHYEYDHQGRLIKHVAADGQCYGYWWNAQGLLTAFKQNHAVTRYSYDTYGEINGVANPDGSITEYQRNSAGNIAQTRHYHPDHETPAVEQSYTYDDAGRLISHTDPIGRISHIVWGGLSQPEKIIQPDGSYVAYQYDQERNLTSITRSDGCNYQLEWDAEERVSRTIGFDGRDQHYAYDANSQLIAVREGDRTVHLVRDTAGRVIEKQTIAESGARDSQLYDYDVIGRLLNANTTARKLRFEWQGSKQLSTTWQDAWQLQYEYDEQGNRTQLILPDGQCLGYQYDSQQQLSAITLNGADVLKVKRDKLGRELKRHQANGITQQCDFDNHGRLQQQKWTSEHDNSHRRQYHYDSASQLIAIQDNALGRQQFSYDKLNQLQAHHQNNTTTHYQFDSFGNPSLGKPDFEESESTNDRLQRYQSKIFDYDKCGNQSMVRDEYSAQHRQFNGFNQLTQLSHNGRYSHYDYDALGRRSRKTTEQSTVDFLWDGDQLIGEHSQGQYRWYIYAPNDFTPLALFDNGALYFYHTDHLGTPHTVTDSEGDVVWQATYNALGCAFISIDIIHNPLRFQGQYHDQESVLHYNRFRYYDPSIGQFIHQDPIGLLGGINHYRYAPNPIQWVDPLGLSCKEGGGTKGIHLPSGEVLPFVDNIVTSEPVDRGAILNFTRYYIDNVPLLGPALDGIGNQIGYYTSGLRDDSAKVNPLTGKDLTPLDEQNAVFETVTAGIGGITGKLSHGVVKAVDFDTYSKIIREHLGDASSIKLADEISALHRIRKNVKSNSLLNQKINRRAIPEWNFRTQGVNEDLARDYLMSSEGTELLSALKVADPLASDAVLLNRAMELVSSGSQLPKAISIKAGEQLVKVVPEGQQVSSYSPFFTTKSSLEKASKSRTTLVDLFGLPKVSESPRYSIYQVEAEANSRVFVSPVAPTVEKLIHREGGALQYLIPNRKLWSDPILVGNTSN